MQTSLYTAAYIYMLVIAMLAAAATLYFLFLRKPPLQEKPRLAAQIVLLISIGVALFVAGMWLGDQITPFVVVEPASQAMEPFRQLQVFDFEADAGGWMIDDNCGEANMTVEKNAANAYQGEGYVSMNVNLTTSEESEQAITLKQMACFKYEPKESWQLELTDGVIAYIKVNPGLDALGNNFQAEFQVRGANGEEMRWAKARYPLKAGEWTPVVWVKPSWITIPGQELFFPPMADGIWITVWSDKSFKGDILFDNIGLYMLQRR